MPKKLLKFNFKRSTFLSIEILFASKGEISNKTGIACLSFCVCCITVQDLPFNIPIPMKFDNLTIYVLKRAKNA